MESVVLGEAATPPPEGNVEAANGTLPCCGRSLFFASTDEAASPASTAGIGGGKRCLACQFSQIALRISGKVPHAHSCLKFRSCDGGPSVKDDLQLVVPFRGLSTPPAMSSWGPLASPRGPECPGTPGRKFAGVGQANAAGALHEEGFEEIRIGGWGPRNCSNNNSNSSSSSSIAAIPINTSSNSDSRDDEIEAAEGRPPLAAEEAGPPGTIPQASPGHDSPTSEGSGGPPAEQSSSSSSNTSGNNKDQQQQQEGQQQEQQQQPKAAAPNPAAAAAADDPEGDAAAAETRRNGPLVLIITGMAGSGKSTLVKAMDQYLRSLGRKVYLINLDPAVSSLAFEANVDIRDSVDYRRVMEHYKLGPNGAILTSLNLFATKFGSLLLLLQRRSSSLDVVLVDTPGQIEVFTWSASGALITEALGATFPTAIVYTVDACRSKAPNTLLSNMVHACSVLYRHKLPFLAVFNKVDAEDPGICLEWLRDYDRFQEALLEDNDRYLGSLGRSTALALCGFYEKIQTLEVSAVTMQGMQQLPERLAKLREEYAETFIPYLMQQREKAQQKKLRQQQEQLNRFAADSGSSSSSSSSSSSKPAAASGAAAAAEAANNKNAAGSS